jgi:hypothetical protein
VIIAAYTIDRWDHIREAVESVQRQTVPVLETILVIDHNAALLERARKEIPDITIIPNAGTRGASATRNTGVAASQGEVVAFLDDDALAGPQWLENMLRHFAVPEVVGAGGGINPIWAAAPPRWFPPEFYWAIGASYRGMPEQAAPVRNVWSCNMAIRRKIFDAIDGFRDGFGKVGNRSRPEDTDLCLRAAAAQPGGYRTPVHQAGPAAGFRPGAARGCPGRCFRRVTQPRHRRRSVARRRRVPGRPRGQCHEGNRGDGRPARSGRPPGRHPAGRRCAQCAFSLTTPVTTCSISVTSQCFSPASPGCGGTGQTP